MGEALLEGGEDLVAGFAFHRKDEREAEFGLVALVELAKAREFGWGALVEAGTRLLGGGCRGQVAAERGAAGEIGVAADQGKLVRARRPAHDVDHRAMQRLLAAERAGREGLLRDPG